MTGPSVPDRPVSPEDMPEPRPDPFDVPGAEDAEFPTMEDFREFMDDHAWGEGEI